MEAASQPIRVVIAKVGLDGHDRGVKIVARTLRDAGMKRYNPINISGYHISEAGGSPLDEVAFTMCNLITYVEEVTKTGMLVDEFAPRLAFFYVCQSDFFEEIAKFRAVRRVYAKIMGSRIGDGVVVEQGGCIGAGAWVEPGTVVRAGWIWAGRPARAFRELKPEERTEFARARDIYVGYSADYLGAEQASGRK